MYVQKFLLSTELSRKEQMLKNSENSLIARFLLSIENLRIRKFLLKKH